MKKTNLPSKRIRILGDSFEDFPFSEEDPHLVAPAKFRLASLSEEKCLGSMDFKNNENWSD